MTAAAAAFRTHIGLAWVVLSTPEPPGKAGKILDVELEIRFRREVQPAVRAAIERPGVTAVRSPAG